MKGACPVDKLLAKALMIGRVAGGGEVGARRSAGDAAADPRALAVEHVVAAGHGHKILRITVAAGLDEDLKSPRGTGDVRRPTRTLGARFRCDHPIERKKTMAHMHLGRSLLRKMVRDVATTPNSTQVVHPLLFAGQGIRYRKLEVILTTSIDKLGKAGETVKVAPGYFRNHLMPKLLAVPNTEKFAYLIKEQRKLYDREEAETVTVVPETKEDKMKEYQAAAKRLDNACLGLRRLIKEERELRNPVTKDELVDEVARQLCVKIHPDNLRLPSPLTSLGEYEVPLCLPKAIPRPEGKVEWTLKVKVRSR
ncbi:hypothetical protein H6P81_012891 [Aristolochia fimbriata]|uniref:Large ribosomal subunit protein bL9c n=1 Tax=Aristolochia fimbriata TaxID=158543 RepID=A0AAV7EHR9_ARIFI|nr:hypothetical protein H6P81_012891 [Aristolochia fimbriata]